MSGVAVDDDGSVYFQQADLINLTGANIVKITPTGTNNTRSLATNGFMTMTTLDPTGGVYGTVSGPVSQANRFTIIPELRLSSAISPRSPRAIECALCGGCAIA